MRSVPSAACCGRWPVAEITNERLREIIEGTYCGFDEGAAIAAELLVARAELRRISEWHDQIADTVPCDVAGPHYGIVEWHQIVLAERDAAHAEVERLRAELRTKELVQEHDEREEARRG